MTEAFPSGKALIVVATGCVETWIQCNGINCANSQVVRWAVVFMRVDVFARLQLCDIVVVDNLPMTHCAGNTTLLVERWESIQSENSKSNKISYHELREPREGHSCLCGSDFVFD